MDTFRDQKVNVNYTKKDADTQRERDPLSGSLVPLCLICLGLVLSGCNRGLSPTQASSSAITGFGGTVRFVSSWPHPPQDSVYDLRVVAFRDYPPQNILLEVSSGNAIVYPPTSTTGGLPKFVDSLSYDFTLDSASTFQYVVVAMRYGTNVFSDWKVVGAYGYSHGAGSPRSVVVQQGSFLNGIDIEVDFQNTPPTPFLGLAFPAARH